MHVEIPTEAAWRGAPRYIVTGVWTPCQPAIEEGSPTTGMSTWKPSGCACHLGGFHNYDLAGLGAATLTPEAALQMALSMYSGANLNPKDNFSNTVGQIRAGQFDAYQGCSGQAPNMNLLTTASGIALSAGGAATGIMVATHVISAATGAIVGAATLGIGALVSVIAIIFAHHAAAERRDLNFSCSAVPAVNNALSVINKAVQSGQTTPAAAMAALDEVYSQFMAAGGASGGPSGPGNIPDSGTAINKHPYCNSNCVLSVVLKAMVLYWQAQYQAMITATAAPSSSAAVSSQPGVSAGVPASSGFPWLLALLGVGAAWAFS